MGSPSIFIPGQPVGIEVMIHFETEDEEIKVKISPMLTSRNSPCIRLHLEFDRDNGLVDLQDGRKVYQTPDILKLA